MSNPKVSADHVILPPATIGMVGGGQLGRMFAIAAASMGYEVVVFCAAENEPAAQVAHRCVFGRLDNADAVTRFAKQCDVITLEFENLSAEMIAKCSEFAPTYPSANVLATAQDRLIEKTTLRDASVPVTPFAEVSDADSLIAASQTLGWPVIVKTARSGYDGKGQQRVSTQSDAASVPWESADSWIVEKCIEFDREVSVVVARTVDGRTKCFPVFENDHCNHILDVTTVPANVSPELEKRALEVAVSVAQTLDVVGLICVEMFVLDDGVLMVNEVAPRPHNSGHLSIEAMEVSQFQQQVRAVCGLNLGSTDLIGGGAAMANLLGDLWGDDGVSPDWNAALSVPGVHLHLYGKQTAKKGRKMGHLTATADTVGEAKRRVEMARNALAKS
ncbi:5-(carboxyamino)imidazole ribonucleotide synthase [Planctomycetes bacterium K23_9]|uniref:N5-carboxyaminoimidazole ribonucleotide synthase n=1 Tax=Stieleria marina TaxID=1930275 RepID=A0A517NX66_9BACT|nr:N5-carboxyaminoimidazole ribonucleotide synthase [Planctomycetes bacterium K23_9]